MSFSIEGEVACGQLDAGMWNWSGVWAGGTNGDSIGAEVLGEATRLWKSACSERQALRTAPGTL